MFGDKTSVFSHSAPESLRSAASRWKFLVGPSLLSSLAVLGVYGGPYCLDLLMEAGVECWGGRGCLAGGSAVEWCLVPQGCLCGAGSSWGLTLPPLPSPATLGRVCSLSINGLVVYYFLSFVVVGMEPGPHT